MLDAITFKRSIYHFTFVILDFRFVIEEEIGTCNSFFNDKSKI